MRHISAVRFKELTHHLNLIVPEAMYEGGSICNENSPVYPNVLYLHTL